MENGEIDTFAQWYQGTSQVFIESKASDSSNQLSPAEFERIKESAEAGDSGEQLNLAYAYLLGNGTKPDKDKYLFWRYKAALNGCAQAQMLLGIAYWKGIGMDVDLKEAVTWLKLAQANGHPQAEKALAKLEAGR